MAVDVALVITSVIFAILVMIGAFYFVVYFQHPQDKMVAWFPKAVVVISLSLAAWNLFLLPLDVANQKGVAENQGLPMEKLTIGFYGATMGMIILVVPFTIYYYEGEDSDDDGTGESARSAGAQFGYAIKYIIPTILVFAGIVAGMYYGGLGYADIQTTYLQAPLIETTELEAKSLDAFFSFNFYCNSSALGKPIQLTPRVPIESNTSVPVFTPNAFGDSAKPGFGCGDISGGAVCCKVQAVNSVVASPIVFVVAIVTLIGWAIFSVFAGVGMASLPYDWLNEFKYRPKPITAAEYQERKKIVGEQSSILMEAYKSVNAELKAAARANNFNRRYRTAKNKENQFRKDVVILEYHYRNLEDSYRFQGGNILLQYTKFGIACLSYSFFKNSVLLTLLWLIHIALFVIPITLQMKGLSINPIAPFLNEMLSLTKDVPIVGIALYALFIFYLLGCVMKGNAKLGMRIIFFTIHPLVIGETLMSALVFNAGIVLLCSLPLAYFGTIAFSDYAKFTSNQSIFGVQIASLKGISWGFDIFLYVLIGTCALTFFFSLYNPYKRQKENKLNFNW